MSKYRKKPVVIEAILWNGGRDAWLAIEKLAGNRIVTSNLQDQTITIATLEGNMKVSKGDYVIQGVRGEIYPCKPDIFEATYETVEEDI